MRRSELVLRHFLRKFIMEIRSDITKKNSFYTITWTIIHMTAKKIVCLNIAFHSQGC